MNGYRAIAVAVTNQMIKDYFHGVCTEKEMEDYINYSPFFAILGIDEERAIRLLKERRAKHNGKKKRCKDT